MSNTIEAVLVIDFGTSNVHVSVVDCADGEMLCGKTENYKMYHPMPQMSELHPSEVWLASEKSVGAVISSLPENVRLCAVAFSYFGDSIMAVDCSKRLMTDLMLCFDARGAEQAIRLSEKFGRRFITYTGEPCTLYCVASKILWLQENKPEIFDKTVSYWSIQQYILDKLGLPILCDRTMAARYALFDNANNIWAEEILSAVGIDASYLPETVESTEIIGTISQYGEVKLPQEVPVVIGAHDCECGIVGTGAFDKKNRILGEITGTFDHMGLICSGYQNPMDVQPDTIACGARGPFRNSSTCSASVNTAGSVLEWFMREIIGDTSQKAYAGLWDYVKLDGTGDLFCVPVFTAAQGKMVGLDISQTKEDLFASIIEGITFEVKKIFDSYRTFWNNSFEVVRVGGGLARSEKWMKLRADMFGCRTECMQNIEVSAVGAAIMGSVAADVYDTHEEAAKRMAVVSKSYEPDKEICEKYQKKFERYLQIGKRETLF